MTLTIDITPETERELESEAANFGMSKAELAKAVIEKRFARAARSAQTRDYSGDRTWYRENKIEYAGKYVATYGNELIAAGSSYKEVGLKARELGYKDALLVFVEEQDGPPFVDFVS